MFPCQFTHLFTYIKTIVQMRWFFFFFFLFSTVRHDLLKVKKTHVKWTLWLEFQSTGHQFALA